MDVRTLFLELKAGSNVRHYKKLGFVTARSGNNETIITVIDGVTETQNFATPDDMVITGASGEVYATSKAKFMTRYDPVVGEPGRYQAKGECCAAEVPANVEPFSFMAPWGEDMICHPGDFLATTDVNDPLLKDLYRIERVTFEKTYKLHG